MNGGISTYQKGLYVEQLFILNCLTHNINVSSPIQQQNCRYDFIVDIKGKLYRVHVKKMVPRPSRDKGFYVLPMTSKHYYYSKGDFDFYAFYHPYLTKFIILPFRSASRFVFGQNILSTSQWFPYFDNWSFNK